MFLFFKYVLFRIIYSILLANLTYRARGQEEGVRKCRAFFSLADVGTSGQAVRFLLLLIIIMIINFSLEFVIRVTVNSDI